MVAVGREMASEGSEEAAVTALARAEVAPVAVTARAAEVWVLCTWRGWRAAAQRLGAAMLSGGTWLMRDRLHAALRTRPLE